MVQIFFFNRSDGGCSPSWALHTFLPTLGELQVLKGLDLFLPSPLRTPVSWALLRMFSSMLFLVSFHFRIPKGFLDFCASAESLHAHFDPAIFTVVLAINDKHTLPVRHLPTISPFWHWWQKAPKFFSPPLTSMSKKRHAPLELLQ